jgi:hypothetical protein
MPHDVADHMKMRCHGFVESSLGARSHRGHARLIATSGYFAGGYGINPEGAAGSGIAFQIQPIGTGRSSDMNERWQSIVIDEDYTDEELGVRERLWCRSYAPVLAFGALFWGLAWWLA